MKWELDATRTDMEKQSKHRRQLKRGIEQELKVGAGDGTKETAQTGINLLR